MIKQAQYEYKDVENENELEQSGLKIFVDFKNLNHHYKEIKQVEAYSAESLMGKTTNSII